jgi:hypothetical protein
MLELSVLLVAAAVAVGGAVVACRPRAVAWPRPGALIAGLIVAVALGFVGAATLGASPVDAEGVRAGVVLASSAAWGAITCEFARVLAAAAAQASASEAARAAGALALGEGLVLAGLAGALLVAGFVTGALLGGDGPAPALALVAVGYAAGACARPDPDALAPASAALDAAAHALVAVAVFLRNGVALRAGPVATSAVGLVVLAPTVRALALLAVGGAALSARPEGEAAVERSLHVAFSLLVLAVGAAAFGLAGVFWPSLLFCGASGVAIVLGLHRTRAGGPRWLHIAVAGAPLFAAWIVAWRTGLVSSLALGVLGCAAGAQAARTATRWASAARGEANDGAGVAATFLGAIVLAHAVDGAGVLVACRRWASGEHLPFEDAATLLARCEGARVVRGGADLLRPGVVVGLGAGAIAALDTMRSPTRRERDLGLVLVVVLAAALSMRIVFGEGSALLAAFVGGSIAVELLARALRETPREAESRLRWLAALCVAIAPLVA